MAPVRFVAEDGVAAEPNPAYTVIDVPGDVPFVELPDRIEFSLDEVSSVLEVLDIAEAAARTDDERAAAREAIRIVTSKLWPELGDLLDRDDDE